MRLYTNPMLTQVVHEYSRLMESFKHHPRKTWHEMSETRLWEELCLCILSSNVSYELALSAFWHLRNMRLLNPKWIIGRETEVERIADELSKRIYLPRRKDGSLRKYRFPHTRARNIVNATKVLYQNDHDLLWVLRKSDSEQEARAFLAENIPGVGLKQASHFLRNIGYSRSLAIIDSHVMGFLIEMGAIRKEKIKIVTPEIYIRLEKVVKNLCDSLGVNLSIFDMAIWQYMRGRSK